MKNKTLILGASSFIGRRIFKFFKQNAVGTYCSQKIKGGVFFDAIYDDLEKTISDLNQFSHAIILLGYSNPDICVKEIKRSKALNVDGIKRILNVLKRNEIKPIFMSSEFVFDGKSGMYSEKSLPSPTLVYGKQKYEIEQYMETHFNHYCILRLAKVYGSEPDEKGLFIQFLNKLLAKETILCPVDQRFSPVFVQDVVRVVDAVIKNNLNGIYHVGGPAPASRLECLNAFLNEVRQYVQLKPKIENCQLHDLPTVEKWPVDVTFSVDKLINDTGVQLTHYQDFCRQFVRVVNEA